MTKLTQTKDGRWYIETDYEKTQTFDLGSPVNVHRFGLNEKGDGVYQLTYVLKEEGHGVK